MIIQDIESKTCTTLQQLIEAAASFKDSSGRDADTVYLADPNGSASITVNLTLVEETLSDGSTVRNIAVSYD